MNIIILILTLISTTDWKFIVYNNRSGILRLNNIQQYKKKQNKIQINNIIKS